MRCRSNPLANPETPGHQKLLDLHTQILAYMRDGTEESRVWIDDMEERALRAGASPQDIATIWEIAHRRSLTMAMGKKDNPAWRTTMRRKRNLSMEEFKTKAMSMARRSAEATKRGAVAVGRGAKSLAERAAPHVKRGAIAVGRAAKKGAKFTAKQTGRGMAWTGEKMKTWGSKANPGFLPTTDGFMYWPHRAAFFLAIKKAEEVHNKNHGLDIYSAEFRNEVAKAAASYMKTLPEVYKLARDPNMGPMIAEAMVDGIEQWAKVQSSALTYVPLERGSGPHGIAGDQTEWPKQLERIRKSRKGRKSNPFIPSFEAPCWERLHNHFGSGLTAFRLAVSPDLVYMIEPTSYGAWLAHAGDQWNVVVALDPQGVERSSGAYEYSSKEDALGAVRKNARMRAKQAADEAATEIAKIKKPNPTAKQKANSPARGVIPGFKEPGWQFIEFDTHEFGYALKAPGGIHYRVVATTPETWVAFANDDLVTANGDVAAYESGKHVYAGSGAALAAVRKHYRKRGPKQNPTAKQKAKEGLAALLQRLGFSVRLNKNLPYVGGPGWEITMRGTGYYFPFDGGVWVRKESGATTQVEGNWNFKAPYTESGQQAAVRWVLQTEGIPVAGQNGGRSRMMNPRRLSTEEYWERWAAFKPVALETPWGWAHAYCLGEVSKDADSQWRGIRSDRQRSAWPRGAACVLCGGRTKTPRVDDIRYDYPPTRVVPQVENPRAPLKHPKQVKWTKGEYWPSSHYNPSPTVIYKGKELPCGCGSRDDISVWEWAEYIHVLCVNTGLGYVGLKVFDLARAADVGTLPTDHPAKDDEVGLVGEMFMDRDYDIEETFGKRGLSRTSGKKMVETLDQWIK